MAAPISHLQLIHSLKSCLRASTWHPPAHTHSRWMEPHMPTLSLLSLCGVSRPCFRCWCAILPRFPVCLSLSVVVLSGWFNSQMEATVRWAHRQERWRRRGGSGGWMDGWMDVGLLTQPSAATLSSPLSFALFRSLLWLQLGRPIQFPAHPVIRLSNHPPQSLLTMNLIHRGSHKESCTSIHPSIHQYHYAACRVIFGHEEDINT